VENHKRTIAKTASWRVLATLITTIIAWLLTGELRFAATVGVLDTLVKLAMYYVHERAWNRLDYGRVDSVVDYEI
jgi:uncharacterized membrane protein